MITIAIVEDKPEYQNQLKQYIEDYFDAKKEQTYELSIYSNGLDFLDDFENGKIFNIVFLDIELPGENGINVAKKIRTKNNDLIIIFTTIMTQYAVKGYEVDALDYMVKPIQYLNFSLKLDKALKLIKKKEKTFLFEDEDEQVMVKIKSSQIYFIEIYNHTCVFHSTNGNFKKYISISNLEEELKNDGFLRCNNSYIINPIFVTKITKDSIFINDTELLISRRRKKEFLNKLAKYL